MMADSQTPWSFVLYLLTILWIPYAEWTIGLKEKYLEDKYGEGFRQYRDRVPKYLLVA
jgi:protein-S-isoprenylcysteine O-methyltransferase Ste14